MRTFHLQATRERLPLESVIPALRRLFASGCEVPAHQVPALDTPDGEGVTSPIMPAYLPGRRSAGTGFRSCRLQA